MGAMINNLRSFLLLELGKGLFLTLKYFFKPKVTINYPYEKGSLSPRFRGEHALRRYSNGEERALPASCARPCARRRPSPSRPSRARRRHRDALRYRHDEMHLLRLLSGSLPDGCHRRGPNFEFATETREELYYDKDKLWRTVIAGRRNRPQPCRRRAGADGIRI